ncbi:MAG: hypothetical protein EXQ93_06600 [Alphaproteobacteria bacterium]|nr:hypothetical protein [Alphaproteobacteria bacterium]
MKSPFDSLATTVVLGLAVTVVMVVLIMMIGTNGVGAPLPEGNAGIAAYVMRWAHVVSGVMWIGLLWYFNFVQTPSMAEIPAEMKPAVSKFIAPRALWWFRWSAASTVLFGVLLAGTGGYIVDGLALGLTNGGADTSTIGFGMWLALFMAFNVWFIIWPNQKKALGIVTVADDEKKKAARMAFLASRFNTMLSLPMLFAMLGMRHFADLI